MGIMRQYQINKILVTTAVAGYLIIGSSSVFAKVIGDMRVGYFASARESRSEQKTESKQSRLRLRLGYSKALNSNWSAKVRFAGRYSDDQKSNEHKFFQEIPGGDGLNLGEGTLDTVYFRYLNKAGYTLTIGRQQTKKELAGVAKKSLDRNTSPNTDVSWTDGVVFSTTDKSKWQHQAIAQINYAKGATEVRRGSLDFSNSATRVSYFYALENKNKVGAIVQRGFDISYLPKALCVDGSNCLNRTDYLGLVARGAAKWPLSNGNRGFMLAASFGYAPNTQLKSTAKIGNSGKVSGTAVQITANLINFLHLHSIGLVVGRVDAGWLLSPDFRNNNSLIELRYKWVIDKKQKVEARIRQREELEKQLSAQQKQVDTDFYLRYTVKF